MSSCFIRADWPAPTHIIAGCSTRLGGFSQPPFDSLNLATHVGDNALLVDKNRQQLFEFLNMPPQILWLQQVHGTEVCSADDNSTDSACADAIISQQAQRVCLVLTADCLPLLVCNTSGSCVAAIHAGWRGLLNGIIEKTIKKCHCDPASLLVWMGPAISAQVYEVGDEIRTAFIQQNAIAEQAFTVSRPQHWLMDLILLASQRLHHIGVTAIYGGEFCSYREHNKFFSYRRDGTTGRMASLIWINPESQI